MKKQFLMRNTLIVLLSAILILCAAVLATTAFAGTSNACAAETQRIDAPLAYEYTAQEGDANAYYTVTGIDTAAVTALNLTDDQKKNLKITIPAEYNDGNNTAPVKAIGDKAFSESISPSVGNANNTGLDFVELDLSKAVNLETIGAYAFIYIKSEQVLTLPINVKKISQYAFSGSEISGIVFNDALEYVEQLAFINMSNLSGTVKITPNMQFVNTRGEEYNVNVFTGTKIEAFIVDEGNEHYKAIDGVLYTIDGTGLIAYPGGKEVADVFRVPTEVTRLEDRAFSDIENIKTIVLPSTLQFVGAFQFAKSTANVYIPGNLTATTWSNDPFYYTTGYVVCDTEAVKTELSNKLQFKSLLSDGRLLCFNGISAVFNSEAEGTIPTNATVEDLKQHFTVTGNATGKENEEITIPLDNFTLELPENGLVKGSNTVTIKYSDYSDTVDIDAEGTTPPAPETPVVSGTPTANSITLTAIEGGEYSCDNGATWQDSPIFTGLEANTEYTFLARIKATDTANASPASVVLTIKTAEITAKGGLSGGAIAGIVIGSVLVVGILALLALFLFRKNKSQGFKDYYVGLGGTCAATVKGWGGKIKELFRKENAEKPTETLPEENAADQDSVEESDDEDAEPKN